MKCPEPLKDAIEGLYSAFAGYPLAENTNPVPNSHAPDANDLLHAAPLRDLGWEHLGDYATDALVIGGDLEVFKHFLPRIFGLIVNVGEGMTGTPSPETIFVQLRYGRWRTWPEPEQRAVEVLLDAVFHTLLGNLPTEGTYVDVDEWICSISQAEEDLGLYLQQWEKDERLSAAWALASLILCSVIAYTGTDHAIPSWDMEDPAVEQAIEQWCKLPHRGSFWKDCDAQYAQLQAWVRSPAALEKLRRAESVCEDSALKRELATAQRCVLEAPSAKFEAAYRKRAFQSAYWASSANRLY